MKTLYGILACILLAGSGWVGYKIAAGDLAKCRAERDAIVARENVAKTMRDQTARELEDGLAKINAEHEKKIIALNKEAEAQRSELKIQLANAKKQIRDLESDRGSIASERQRIKQELQTAKGESADTLKKKDAELVVLQDKLRIQVQGLKCLEENVPADAVHTLNNAKI